MVDIHSHILAEVDDGPKSWDVSEQMCRIAKADGIEHMVATPHANHRYSYDRLRLLEVLDSLRQRIGDAPKLSLGCDFHLSYENLQDVMVHPERYVIGNTRYLLVELSNYGIPAQIAESYAQLIRMNLTPIITHPERNPILQKAPKQILQWIELGCAVQVTASAFTGAWGEVSSQIAKWLLARDAVHFLATDAHDTRRRPPIMSGGREAVVELRGEAVANALVNENPQAVVANQALPYFPQPVNKP
jgi:protein-tyrosine phosphatase